MKWIKSHKCPKLNDGKIRPQLTSIENEWNIKNWMQKHKECSQCRYLPVINFVKKIRDDYGNMIDIWMRDVIGIRPYEKASLN